MIIKLKINHPNGFVLVTTYLRIGYKYRLTQYK